MIHSGSIDSDWPEVDLYLKINPKSRDLSSVCKQTRTPRGCQGQLVYLLSDFLVSAGVSGVALETEY